MKKITLIPLLLTLFFTGCQKQQAEDAKTDPAAITTQFEKSDAVIGAYLDKLESLETYKEEKTQILCKDYPAEYKTKYIPALLVLSPGEYTEANLLADLKSVLDYYKNKSAIKC
ncbi:hypothetical protein BEN74_18645 [Acinetobacter sp. WCHAc010034]|uniref:hypothetical protein n=1 Tax=Acinetobacter sp. WCHAc010034 TaxID=1879049 RepID=UPI00083A188F|nr:hypothetical protein [Acinetobacter sp. WCHAc010034]AYA04604.1 hypothetical protein BEN74_18645 [Acinetobacter sp. WCHAc010034]